MSSLTGLLKLHGTRIGDAEATAAGRACTFLSRRNPAARLSSHADDAVVMCQHAAQYEPGPEPGEAAQDSTGRFTIVFDGDIHNRRDLRSELEARGAIFPADHDRDLVLADYWVWGSEAPAQLRGTFVFSIYDATTGTLFCARDHFGTKPFHFALHGDTVLFASDLPTLLAWQIVKPALDPEALAYYLSFGQGPADRSLLAGIRRLRPAHSLTVERSGYVRESRYWSLAEVDPAQRALARPHLKAEFRERFDEAVRVAGCGRSAAVWLTGADGLALAASMARTAGGPIKTFSFCFAGAEVEDVSLRTGSDLSGTEHHMLRLGIDVAAEMPNVVAHCGEPVTNLSILMAHAATRLPSPFAKTLVSAHGANEVLLAHDRYLRLRDTVEMFRRSGPPAFRPGFHQTPPFIRDLYHQLAGGLPEHQRLELAGPVMAHTLLLSPIDELGVSLEPAMGNDAMDLASRSDLDRCRTGELLAGTGERGRQFKLPMLNLAFIDWCASLPQDVRLFEPHGGTGAQTLLQASLDLPQDVLRTLPQSAAPPLGHWLKHGLRDMMQDTFATSAFRTRGLFNLSLVDDLTRKHLEGIRSSTRLLWSLLCLEAWFKIFIDGASTSNVGMPAAGALVLEKVA